MNVADQFLARRYAQALLRVCGNQFSPETIAVITHANAFLRKNEQVRYFLSLPDFPVREKSKLIQRLLDTLQLPICFKNVVVLLADHKRLRLLVSVLDSIVRLYQDQQGIMSMKISSSTQLQEKQLDMLRRFLEEKTGKSIQDTFNVDKSLIAGIRLQSDSLLWEYSVRKKLRAIRLSVMR